MNMLQWCQQKASEIPYVKNRERVYSAILNHKGKLIAHGPNEYTRSHPTQKAYSVKAGLSDARIYLHAECRVIVAAAKLKPKDCKLIVVRVNKSGNILDSCPCISCRLLISDVKFITKVEYGVGKCI